MSALGQKQTFTDWTEVSLGSLMHGLATYTPLQDFHYDIEASPVVLI